MGDAPNPVSMRGICGEDTALEPLLEEVVGEILTLVDTISSPEGRLRLHELYLRLLYRRDGLPYPFFIPSDIRRPVTVIPSATDRHFEAAIEDVDPTGALLLRHPDGTLSSHLFKEVAFIIDRHN